MQQEYVNETEGSLFELLFTLPDLCKNLKLILEYKDTRVYFFVAARFLFYFFTVINSLVEILHYHWSLLLFISFPNV